MSEWVLHCEVKQRHIRRSQPTRDAALKDACSQLLQGYSVNRIERNYYCRWTTTIRPSPITTKQSNSIPKTPLPSGNAAMRIKGDMDRAIADYGGRSGSIPNSLRP